MTHLNLALTDELILFVEAQSSLDGYSSAGEFIRALIREEQGRRARRTLDDQLRVAVESGPSTPMTPDDWGTLEARVWERHRSSPERS